MPRLLHALILLAACSGDRAAEKEAEEALGFDWEGGEFDFTTWQVEDACLDGAMEALFMPDGPSVPQEFEYPVYIPSYSELPISYDIDLREPFVGMPVTIEDAGEGWMQARGSIREEVALGAAAYGDCVVTMTVDIDLLPVGPDSAECEARVAVSDARGDDGRCPVYESDPCLVTLAITAARR